MGFVMSSKSLNIMVVEDDAALRESLARVLIAEGYGALVVTSGRGAIATMQTTSVDAVLLDLGLGTDDGWTAFHSLKQLDPSLPIIVMSGQADRLVHPFARLAAAVVEKPFD